MRTIVSLLDGATSVVYCWFLFPHIEELEGMEYCFPLVWMKHMCQDPLLELRLSWTVQLLPVKAECLPEGESSHCGSLSRALRPGAAVPCAGLPHHCQGHMESVAFLKNNIHQKTAKKQDVFLKERVTKGTAHISHKSF